MEGEAGASTLEAVLALDEAYADAAAAPGDDEARKHAELYMRRRRQLLLGCAVQRPAGYLAVRHALLSQHAQRRLHTPLEWSPRSLSGSVSRASTTTAAVPARPRLSQVVFEPARAVSLAQARAARGSNAGSVMSGALRRGSHTLSAIPADDAAHDPALPGVSSLDDAYAFSGMQCILAAEHGAAITCLRFANDERERFAFATAAGVLVIASAVSGEVLHRAAGHSAGITDIVWSMTNDLLLTSSQDRTLRVWASADATCLRVIDCWEACTAVDMHPLNNNLLLCGTAARRVLVFNISTGRMVARVRVAAPVSAVTVATDGALVFAATQHGQVVVFRINVATGELRQQTQASIAKGHRINSLAYSSWLLRERQPSLLVTSQDGCVRLLAVQEKPGLALLPLRMYGIACTHQPVRSAFCPLISLRKGACFVTGSEDEIVYLFDLTRVHKACVNKLRGHAAAVLDVAWNYDESFLASGDASGVVIVWKRAAGAAGAPASPPSVA